MPNGTAAGAELLAATLEELIVAVARGVAQAQAELDRTAIDVQRMIDADPDLSLHGLQASWYQMPRTELEIKVALALQEASPAGGAVSAGPRILLQPVNARYQNQFRFDASATSTLRLTIVPVPPRTTDALQVPPKLTADAASALARPLLDKEPGTDGPRRDSRVIANFNAASRTWFVVQSVTDASGTRSLAVVDVNDESGKATRR